MFIAGINLLSPGEICMMAHFHSFATIMFQERKKKKKRNNFLKMFCQNTCNEIAINVNSHFSHYKPMETLSHSAIAEKVHEEWQ